MRGGGGDPANNTETRLVGAAEFAGRRRALCDPVDACGDGCDVSQIVLAGQVSDRFCGNGIAPCDVGSAWSFGETNSYSCPGMPFPGSPSAPTTPSPTSMGALTGRSAATSGTSTPRWMPLQTWVPSFDRRRPC